MRMVELFAGIGGFRRGLESVGVECVGFVEWDKYARTSYESIWPSAKEEWSAHDITTVTDDDLRRLSRDVGGIDILAGGFPCQAFSVAGKRRGFADTRGTLFFDVARFASVLGCPVLLLENVVGLLNHDGGRTFHTILCALDELGYDCEWQVCNATQVGIPQNRERVFIVGHLRGSGTRKVFPLEFANGDAHCILAGRLGLPGKDQWNRVYSPTGHSPTLTTMQGGRQEPKIIELTKSVSQTSRVYDPDGIAPTLRHGSEVTGNISPMIIQRPRGYNEGGLNDIAPTVSSHSYHENNMVVESGLIHSRGFETRKDGISHCIKGAEGGSSKNFIKVSAVLTPDREEIRHSWDVIQVPVVRNRGEWSERDTAQCLDANYYKGIDNHGARTAIATETRIRKLTPLECWRLMGRDDWEFQCAKDAGVSDSQLYKQAGNSLIPQIVEAIGKKLLANGNMEATTCIQATE
jgi:DNA (cytosine-5)-methyltransferase 1